MNQPDQCAASFLPCLLLAVLDGRDRADNLPPTLLLHSLLLASIAFLAEFRMASVLRDAGLRGKRTVTETTKRFPSAGPEERHATRRQTRTLPIPCDLKHQTQQRRHHTGDLSKAVALQSIITGQINSNPYL